MSEAELALVQRNSAAFSARDVDGMLDCYTEDATVVDLRRVGFGTFTGHEQLRAYYGGIIDAAFDLHEDLEVLAARDGLVAAHCELRGRLASDPGGPEVGAAYGLVLHLRDLKIAKLEVCEDGEHALEVSGLRPIQR
jgi:ketosteroid isomerase-like protein